MPLPPQIGQLALHYGDFQSDETKYPQCLNHPGTRIHRIGSPAATSPYLVWTHASASRPGVQARKPSPLQGDPTLALMPVPINNHHLEFGLNYVPEGGELAPQPLHRFAKPWASAISPSR